MKTTILYALQGALLASAPVLALPQTSASAPAEGEASSACACTCAACAAKHGAKATPVAVPIAAPVGHVEIDVDAGPLTPPATQERGYLGVRLSVSDAGVAVEEVVDGSPASKAGLQAGDVLVSVSGKAVADLDSLTAAMAATRPGQRVAIGYVRDGARGVVGAVLAERPDAAEPVPSEAEVVADAEGSDEEEQEGEEDDEEDGIDILEAGEVEIELLPDGRLEIELEDVLFTPLGGETLEIGEIEFTVEIDGLEARLRSAFGIAEAPRRQRAGANRGPRPARAGEPGDVRAMRDRVRELEAEVERLNRAIEEVRAALERR